MSPDQLRQAAPYLIGLPIALVVLYFRMRGLTRGRPLKLEWLWVTPAIILAFTAGLMFQFMPQGVEWAWMAATLVLGGALGWYRGRLMAITVDPETHALNVQASPMAIIFILLIVGARFGIRALTMGEAQAWHLKAALITDGLMVFALGLFAVQRLEMFLRASRLLAEARASRAAVV